MIQILSKQKSKSTPIILTICLLVTVGLFTLIPLPAPDWYDAIRPGVVDFLHGLSPYTHVGFFNPPWAAALLAPFVIFPEPINRALLATATLASIELVAIKFKATPVSIVLILLSPPALQCFLYGENDWLALLGFALPPQIGLLLVVIKPQIGIGAVIYWLIMAYRKDRIREVLKVFAPLGIAFLLSILLYGFWFLRITPYLGWKVNASLFPFSIPVGLYLLYRAIRRDSLPSAAAASPCLSPYVLVHSWLGAVLSISTSTLATAGVVVGLWALRLLKII